MAGSAIEIAAQHLAKNRNGIVASLKVDLRVEEFGDRPDDARACAAPEPAANVSSATPPGTLGAAAAALGSSWENGQSLPRAHVPLGKKKHGSFGFALEDGCSFLGPDG